MSRDFHITELSPTSGPTLEGHLFGQVNQSLLTAVVSNVVFAASAYVIRKDVGAGIGTTFEDLSAVAMSDASGDFAPWGGTGSFTAGDKIYVACEKPITAIYVKVATPGVWAGDGIEVRYSVNRQYDDTELTGVGDGANGFRAAAGVYKMTIPWPSNIVSFSPQPGSAVDVAAGRAVAARPWLVLTPKNLTGMPSQAPILDRVWLEHTAAGVVWTNFLTSFNAELTDGNFGSPQPIFYTDQTETWYGFSDIAYGMDVAVHRRVASVVNREARYLAADTTLKAMPDFTDASNFYTIGPATLGDPVQNLTLRWTPPNDWAPQSKTFTLADTTQITVSARWLVVRVASINQLGPTNPPLVRGRSREFGATKAQGFAERVAYAFSRIKFSQVGMQQGGAAVVQLLNMHTGKAASVSLPDPISIGRYYELSQEVDGVADSQWDMQHLSGGRIHDAFVHIE